MNVQIDENDVMFREIDDDEYEQKLATMRQDDFIEGDFDDEDGLLFHSRAVVIDQPTQSMPMREMRWKMTT